MAARFILGRAGTGKTQWCLDRIVKAIQVQPLGPPIYWIVPRQATFLAERQLACTNNLGGYVRARILDFQDLATEILTEHGGTALPEITDRGRRMILGHLLRQLQDQLQFFSSVAHQPGVAAELDGAFSEMERSGQEAPTVEQLTQTSANLNPALRAKLHDLSLIYSRYTQFLGQDRLDPNRRLTAALAAIDRCRSLRDCDVYIDSFYDFTGSERLAITSLAKVCQSISVTLTIDPQDPCINNPHHIPADTSLFHRSLQAYRSLHFALQKNAVAIEPAVLLNEPQRFHAPQLTQLEHAFLPSRSSADETTIKPNPPPIQLIEAPDRRAEVDAAARWIRRLTTTGLRYRDIAVLMRTEQDYHQLIEASFREHNIPFFVDHRRTASHHPLLRLIRAAIAVALTNWSHEPMMALLKTGLVGLSDAETDALENYVLLHGIHHGVWTTPHPWTGRRHRTEESDESLAAAPNPDNIDALRRRLVDRLLPFVRAVNAAPQTPVRQLATSVFRLLEAFQCRQQIVEWMQLAADKHNLEESSEHERVWDELVELFDELVDLFGDEPISLKDFSTILDSALEGFDLALTPPTVDQVLIGTVDRTRTPAIKACVLLGLSDGQFPLAAREDSVFTDSDRRALGKSNIDLDPDTARQLLDENFLGYIAMTRAGDRLLVTRSATDHNGRPTAPSSLWQRILDNIPNVPINPVPREEDLPRQLIATPRQLVAGLMRWVRSGANNADWLPIYQWLATHAPIDDAIDIMRSRAWKALSYKNDATLDSARAASLFPSPLNVTARQLESFRMCPYQHFARHGLRLAARERRDVTGADLSNIYHEVLDNLVRDLIQSHQGWQNIDDTESKRKISHLTEKLGGQLRDELMLSTARNRYLLSHIEKTLTLVASTQKAAAEQGDFRPTFPALRFGPQTGNPATDPRLPPLTINTPAGNQVQLRGKIDRIDQLPDGSACTIDYRLRADRLDPTSTFHGLALQLLTSLLVLEKNARHLNPNGKLTPSAAFCIQLLRGIRRQNPEDSPSPGDPLFHLLVKPRGLFDLRVSSKLDKTLTEGPSKVLHLYIKKDGAIGHPNTSEAAAAEEFAALLHHIEQRIGEAADQIIAGRIDIHPYRMGTTTPCSTCEFRPLCRLEPSPGCYNDLEPMARPEMLKRIKEGA